MAHPHHHKREEGKTYTLKETYKSGQKENPNNILVAVQSQLKGFTSSTKLVLQGSEGDKSVFKDGKPDGYKKEIEFINPAGKTKIYFYIPDFNKWFFLQDTDSSINLKIADGTSHKDTAEKTDTKEMVSLFCFSAKTEKEITYKNAKESLPPNLQKHFSEDYLQSGIKQRQALKKKIPSSVGSGVKYYMQKDSVPQLLYKKASSLWDGKFNKDNWNPADIWGFKSGSEPTNESIKNISTLSELNELISKNIKAKNWFPVSLKHIDSFKSEAHIDIMEYKESKVQLKIDHTKIGVKDSYVRIKASGQDAKKPNLQMRIGKADGPSKVYLEGRETNSAWRQETHSLGAFDQDSFGDMKTTSYAFELSESSFKNLLKKAYNFSSSKNNFKIEWTVKGEKVEFDFPNNDTGYSNFYHCLKRADNKTKQTAFVIIQKLVKFCEILQDNQTLAYELMYKIGSKSSPHLKVH